MLLVNMHRCVLHCWRSISEGTGGLTCDESGMGGEDGNDSGSWLSMPSRELFIST